MTMARIRHASSSRAGWGRGALRRPAAQRGSAYLLVLGVSMIVSLIGLTAIVLGRVERRMDRDVQDAVQARLLAQSAIELALQHLAGSPTWRGKTDRLLGDGELSYAVSETGGMLTLEAGGQVGNAVRRCQVRLQVRNGTVVPVPGTFAPVVD